MSGACKRQRKNGILLTAKSVNKLSGSASERIDFVVNRGNDKLYIQSALRLDDETKERQETASLRGTGDFFKKVVITDGYDEPHADGEGIIRVGVLPFLLDETIMKRF